MCGIAGKIVTQGQVTSSQIKKMTDAIAHRGPDDDGQEIIKNCGLGQRRLSIIDLSSKGHQPMAYDRGNYWITFNGEIYNFEEIRDRLGAKGYAFRSHSDTEVILAAYKEWGPKCVSYFNGMFALALFDKKKNVFFAARDRLGKKPFHYYYDGHTLVFASEIKALFTQPEVLKEVDSEAIASYIYWGFVPSPKTGFRGIAKLPPGHYMIFQNGKLMLKRYWSVHVSADPSIEIGDAMQRIKALVDSAVQLRMIADVPLGAFLSGGIDSCVIVGSMASQSERAIKTFTVGASSWGMDERADAKISAAFHRTDHTELEISPKVDDAFIRTLVRAYDEPFGDSSAIPSYYVSKLARQHVTVALNGDGGDENFFGYSNYTTLDFINRLTAARLPAHVLYRLLKPFQPYLYTSPIYQRALRVSHLIGAGAMDGYALYARGYTNLIDMNSLWNDAATTIEKEMQSHLPKNGNDSMSRVLQMDLSHILPDGLMTKMDIASMQWALEGRSPLLDYRLVEFAATLPLSYKYRTGETKWIFKEACREYVLEHIRSLPKRGFVLPVNEWIQTTLHTQFQNIFSDSNHQVFSLVNFESASRMFDLHSRGIIDYSAQLWKLFMLAKWYEEFFPHSAK